jgi:leucyl aminopeptidase
MKIVSSSAQAHEVVCDVLAAPVFDDGPSQNDLVKTLDAKLGGFLLAAAQDERFEGKPGQALTLHGQNKIAARRVLLLGVGKAAAFEAADLRHFAARATRAAGSASARTVAVATPPGKEDERSLQLLAEGAALGRYKFGRYLTGDDAKRPDTVETCTIASPAANAEVSMRALRRAEIVAGAVAKARDLINEPAGYMTPRRMEEEARAMAKAHGLTVDVLGPEQCRELGMGMFLAVAQGSAEEPRFIHLAYKPAGAKKRVCIVGKGVTFDSGGLSLKPSDGMLDMKVDMSGASAVIASMAAIAQLGGNVEVHAFAACTENMPSGTAYKLGDVLRSMNGKTVEINNTDAEGRLTLGDAITYALKQKPDELFDFATLTGACMVALGPHTAGVMANNDALRDRFLAAAKVAGEDMWPLPLTARLRDQLKSEIADMRNTGERWGGALTAGLFLKEFVGDTAWCHVDIAGPASADKEFGAITKGGVGFAVASLVEYLSPRS